MAETAEMEGQLAASPPTAKVQLFGKPGTAAAHAIRDFLHRSGVPFQWIELDRGDEMRRQAQLEGLTDDRLPLCIFWDGTRLERPTVRQVSEKLGWFRSPSRSEYDLSIFGAGPAGLSAAVYATSEGLATVLVERFAVGGQTSTSPRIENYLGFPGGISGAELAQRAREQAARFGAEILLQRQGVRGEFMPGRGIGYLEDGTKIVARATLCATGVRYRRLGLPGEERLQGAGVYYGAGNGEAMLCAHQHVFVVGGGNSAAQAVLHFARVGSKVTMVVRDATLKRSLSQYLIDRIRGARRGAAPDRGDCAARRQRIACRHPPEQRDGRGADGGYVLALPLPWRRTAYAMGGRVGRGA